MLFNSLVQYLSTSKVYETIGIPTCLAIVSLLSIMRLSQEPFPMSINLIKHTLPASDILCSCDVA